MCYSAQIEADYRKFVQYHGAVISIDEFTDLWLRKDRRKTPRALDLAFLAGESQAEQPVAQAIRLADQEATAELQQELAAQVDRLAAAEAKLASAKPTKKAADDQRIATKKIAQLRGRLADLRRLEAQPKDSRIFPGVYAPVLVTVGGKRVVRPMRYQCRPAGKPASYDTKYPGTYNARRDNLEGFWKGQFGHTHGLILMDAFFEHVELPDGKRAILEFRPDDGRQMLVACLWSEWTDGEESLLSFAAITDDPPPEVAAAGHDRCIIPIKPEHVDAWLGPGGDLAKAYAILDDRPRPYYEHRLAA